ncbi:MAG TPA: glycosyltransferase family 1 protein [Hyphomicrobiales bacterium]|nr:glycosyltransferase family 4 protein [Rhodobiaceae bacterium]HXK53803.1 glycosyltransferase family 1 protein [Hyphomicrobiales bacterium]
MIWFEVDDVVRYFLTARQPTGIQRVVSEILAAGIGEAGELRGRFALCRFRASNGRLEPIPAAEFARISAGARRALRTGSRASAWQRAHALLHHGVFVAANVLRARLRDLFASRGRDRAFARLVQPGDILVSLGATWGHRNFAERLKEAKTRYGLRYAMMVHDIIPASNPELCSPAHVANFTGWLAATARETDLFFTPSKFSAATLSAYSRAKGWPGKPVFPVRFGTGFRSQPAGPTPLRLEITEPFVLKVSTIEIRKNHRLLVDVWRRLIERHGKDAVPPLVLVGRVGWQVDDVMKDLAASDYLGGKVIIFSSVSDEMLAAYYRACLFTVFPSMAEGWGLPVEESFAHGKYCICSSASSVPEVGGDFADYFDPADFGQAYDLIERAIFEPGFVKSREERLRAGFKPEKWADTFRSIVAILDTELARKD